MLVHRAFPNCVCLLPTQTELESGLCADVACAMLTVQAGAMQTLVHGLPPAMSAWTLSMFFSIVYPERIAAITQECLHELAHR